MCYATQHTESLPVFGGHTGIMQYFVQYFIQNISENFAYNYFPPKLWFYHLPKSHLKFCFQLYYMDTTVSTVIRI
jgi:hypothetical protein